MPNADVLSGPLASTVGLATGAAGSVLEALTLNSAASTNATVIKASPGDLYEISLTNYSAAPKFVKLYNKASAPTVGTDVPTLTIALPANTEKVYEFGAQGKRFPSGIALAITSLQPVADATAVAAGDVVASLSWV